MRKVLIFTLLLFSVSIHAQWVKQTVDTIASLRGISVVNEKIVWASGTGGTVIRTIDGGKTWKVIAVPGAEKLDFRDVEAFDANTAYILSIGNGESSRIYKTTDGGETWKEQFRNKNEKAFFDAIACWDKNNCIAISDPVDKKFVLIETKNGGRNWTPIDTSKMPEAKDGEAAFAASGTCLITQGKNNVFLVTGGSAARVFRSNDRGKNWKVAETPMAKGTAGSGIFSIAMRDSKFGLIVGGNYEKPTENMGTLALTKDGGKTWRALNGLSGYRSGVAFFGVWAAAVGTSGTEHSTNPEYQWFIGDTLNLNSVKAIKSPSKTKLKGGWSESGWGVGPNGLIAKIKLAVIH